MKSHSALFCFLIACVSFFYAVPVSGQCTEGDLATSYASNNGSRGAMFNIVSGANPVTITGFSANLYGGTTARYEIYYKAGTYVGSETTAANWTMAGAVNSLYVAANNVPTYIPIAMSITIPANSTYGFYVTNTASGGLNYTSSAVTNVTLATNSDLSVVGGVGKAYPFGSTYSYRLFNGTVHYYTGNINENGAIATLNTSSPVTVQNPSGNTVYGSSCDAVIANVLGSGASPISGNTTAKVWLESTQPASYVKRHYEITPASNAGTATGTVTLYFTQQEFTDFNAVNLIKLPVDATDAANNKLNLRIEKRGGVSSNGTGLPATYSGAVTSLTPSSVTWNSGASRWEVVVDVTGFSGFFAKTTSFILPVHLVDFSAKINGNNTVLSWKTENEEQIRGYVLQTSSDAVNFRDLTQHDAKGAPVNLYQATDNRSLMQRVFYRLRIVDADGAETYSKVISAGGADVDFDVYPNPASSQIRIQLPEGINYNRYSISDMSGRMIKSGTLQQQAIIDISTIKNGWYQIKLMSAITGSATTQQFIIQR